MFPVMNQNQNQVNVNPSFNNQQNVQQANIQNQTFSGYHPQTGAPIQQQNLKSVNQNAVGNQNQLLQNQLPQNNYPQNQALQPRNQIQNSLNGIEVNRKHHLMQPSPLQVFEQQYFDEMEKARSDQKAGLQ